MQLLDEESICGTASWYCEAAAEGDGAALASCSRMVRAELHLSRSFRSASKSRAHGRLLVVFNGKCLPPGLGSVECFWHLGAAVCWRIPLRHACTDRPKSGRHPSLPVRHPTKAGSACWRFRRDKARPRAFAHDRMPLVGIGPGATQPSRTFPSEWPGICRYRPGRVWKPGIASLSPEWQVRSFRGSQGLTASWSKCAVGYPSKCFFSWAPGALCCSVILMPQLASFDHRTKKFRYARSDRSKPVSQEEAHASQWFFCCWAHRSMCRSRRRPNLINSAEIWTAPLVNTRSATSMLVRCLAGGAKSAVCCSSWWSES